jgi:glycosyltransferase involved in cell wall biosynthesis
VAELASDEVPRGMRLGIDASNLRDGGGMTHLTEILRAADPAGHGFTQVVVWGGTAILSRVEPRAWLTKCHQPALDAGPARRIWWQHFELAALARRAGCDALLAPGGANSGGFQPVVAMSRNMLPFEWREVARYRWTLTGLRLLLLRMTQARTFRRAEGLIFLTRYARDTVTRVIKPVGGLTTIIPHGIDSRFFHAPRQQSPIEGYTAERPFRLLYVSSIDLYKHQWHVAAAVARLRESGLPITLDLVGQAYPPALARLLEALRELDPHGEFVRYAGPVPNRELHTRYLDGDLCIFASSCENMPNILLEAMASGLPISCSDRGPMFEVLGDAGVYFDPESPEDIARALRELISSPQQRRRLAQTAYQRAQDFSWQRCAGETLDFVAQVIHMHSARRALPESG